MTQTMDVNEELDQKFQVLDEESKLTVALLAFSQCACAHRRFVGLGQMKHAHDYIFTAGAVSTAQRIDPAVVPLIEEIRGHVKAIAADPPDYMEADLTPKPVTREREFLWTDAFEDPVWFDIRHAARRGLTAVEAVLAPRPGPPGPPPGGPNDG
ncbi:MAG TPA: hypothetical protein VH834_19430 [Solirubrobacteraceae bacterium]